MAQSFADALDWVAKSRNLAATLARAGDYAKAQAHTVVTLEHVLLALVTDADASLVLHACNVDLARLNTDVSTYLAGLPERQPASQAAEMPSGVRPSARHRTRPENGHRWPSRIRPTQGRLRSKQHGPRFVPAAGIDQGENRRSI